MSGAESSGEDRGRRKRKGLTCGPSSSAGARCAGCGVDAAWERGVAGVRDRAVSQREGKRVRGAAAEREPAWELAGPSGGVA